MLPRRRTLMMAFLLCVVGVLYLALMLQGDDQGGMDAVVDAVSFPDSHERWAREQESVPEGLVVQGKDPQAGDVEKGLHRHLLLNTVSTPFLHSKPHISFIKLEGVDSSGNDLFLVHGANIEQLKSVCSALEECEGFNSEGWIKSRVAGKKRATIDLYLKQVAPGAGQDSQRLLRDEASGVFTDLLREYAQMEQELQIYIYPTDIGKDIPSLVDYKYGVEQLFISLLSQSNFRTLDPDHATLFFLPSRCTAYRKSVTDLQQGIQRAASLTRDMVTDIRHRFQYWNETLGADHFYVCAHDMGTEVAKLADSGLRKNSMALVNTADYSEPFFVPHKDISIPPHPGRGVIDWSTVGQGGATFDPYQRTRLAFMAGNEQRGPIRPLIYKYYEADPDFHLVRGHMSEEDYLRALKTSKFCLCPKGHKAWSPRVMDALWFGCIPVFLADHYLPPLTELIPWQAISLTVPESQVSMLKTILESVSTQKIATMQSNILRVYRHLTWNDPPQPYDAFHAVLFQLWQRHQVHRTALYHLSDEGESG